MTDRVVRIGGASGYWGDTALGVEQMLAGSAPDYLILDYLAEITMSILAKAKSRDADSGYATDFIDRVMKPFVARIAEKRIKVIANAGGVNLATCRRALEAVAADAGVTVRIGTVAGDDLMPGVDSLRDRDIREMDSGEPLPDRLMSVNAYLGAFPIAAALVVEDYRLWFLGRLRAVEAVVTTQDYLLGPRFTVADISVGYALMLAQSIGLESDLPEATRAYWQRLTERPGFQRALARQRREAATQNVGAATL